MPLDPTPSDEDLMRLLAEGRQDALGPLYSRYARLIFNIAAHSLDRSAAEEVVQDVFLTIWRKAAVFTPDRGSFRPWALQIAHHRILNELRRKSRQPHLDSDPDEIRLVNAPDPGPEPDEVAWRESLRSMMRSAMEELPASQRQAVGMAFFEDKTHEEVAAELHLPLGTVKTQIRSGLQKLRGKLAAVAVGSAIIAVIVTGGVVYHADYQARQRDERALALLTASTMRTLRLTAAPGVSPDTHGQYRGSAGTPLAVLTVSNLTRAPSGETYQAWVRHGGVWRSLGVVHPDTQGHARLIVEGPDLAALPEAVEITREPVGGSPGRRGPVVIAWPGG